MSADEKGREMTRLRELVRRFADDAAAGIAVTLTSPETGRRAPHVFQSSRNVAQENQCLTIAVFSLQPADCSAAWSVVADFSMADVTALYNGLDCQDQVPSLCK